MTDYLTDAEFRAIDLLSEFFVVMADEVIGKEQTRSLDLQECAAHIHVLQDKILAQAAARAYPDRFRLLGCSLEQMAEAKGVKR